MSDEATLRQAVLDDPDTDPPRLAYADWCAQHSDEGTRARGRLIRAQLELVGTAAQVVATGGAQRLVDTITGLLATYAPSWAPTWAGQIQDYSFIRGFVEFVQISARDLLDHGPELFAAAPIRHVDLVEVRELNEDLFRSPNFGRLRSLGLDRQGLYDIHLQLLADSDKLGELRWLSAKHNNFGLPGYAALARSESLPKLVYADFLGNPVDPVEQLGMDGGIVVAAELPEPGKALERDAGRLEWLYREDKTDNRFAYT